MSIKKSIVGMFELSRQLVENIFEIGFSLMRDNKTVMKFIEPALEILQEFLPFDLVRKEGVERDTEWKAPAEPTYAARQPEMEEEPVVEADNDEEVESKPRQKEAAAAAPVMEAKEQASEPELMKLTKKELQEKCDALGIPYNPKDPKAALVEKIISHP